MDILQHNSNSKLPDFSALGYEIEEELGHNKNGGRVTYLASNITSLSPINTLVKSETSQLVVIKQFQFAKIGANWSEYEGHQREIKLLQKLDHPSIPKYLDSFETDDGFCLVQEYKKADSLAQFSYFNPQEIQQIAEGILEVLVYLQKQIPPVIHRDIKPENILVDRSNGIKVYLVDFGLAKIANEEMTASTTIKGTLGFMAPEQIFNRQLTNASDLYGLGATLICLLTKTSSLEIGKLMDENYKINFQPLLPKLNFQFIKWLEKMVAPNLKYRYPDAITALKELKSIDILNTSSKWLQLATNKILLINLGLVTVISTSWIISKNFGDSSQIEPQPIPVVNVENNIQNLLNNRKCINCNLSGANLAGKDLTSVDLSGANLSNANLSGADLRGADFKNANLINADLSNTNQGSTDFRGATMPDGSIHP